MSISDLLIMLAAAVLVVPLAQRLKLGSVPGFLLAGVVLGPSATALVTNVNQIQHISEFGVVFLLFAIGIELNPRRFWRMRQLVFGLGLLQVSLSGLLLSAILYYGFNLPVGVAVLLGVTLALSSTAFVSQLLEEKQALHNHYGQASISILLMQDLAVVPLLTFASLLTLPHLTLGMDLLMAVGESIMMLIAVIVAGRYLLQPIFDVIARTDNAEIFTATALLSVIGVGVITEKVGLSMAMGAFLSGLLIADCTYRHQIRAEILPFRGILLGLFFMSVGMSLNLNVFLQAPFTLILLTLSLMLLKVLVLYPISRYFKLSRNSAWAASLLLAQSGEFALIIFAVAHEENLINTLHYQALLVVVLVSMLLTPPLANLAHRLANREEHATPEIIPISDNTRIILAGFGRIGSRIARMLEQLDISYIAIDKRYDVINKARAEGRSVYYGDARQPALLKSLGLDEHSIVIVTLDDFKAAEGVVEIIHQLRPNAYILARGHNIEQCQKLLQLGARQVISENLEASIQLAQLALDASGFNETEYAETLVNYKQNYYKKIQHNELPPG